MTKGGMEIDLNKAIQIMNDGRYLTTWSQALY